MRPQPLAASQTKLSVEVSMDAELERTMLSARLVSDMLAMEAVRILERLVIA